MGERSKKTTLPTTNTLESAKSRVFIRHFWGVYATYGIAGVSMAGVFLNVVAFSNVIWPGEPFHAFEIGLLVSLMTWATAVAGIFIGYLADRYSRRKIFILTYVIMGCGRFFNGFAPYGPGLSSFAFGYYIFFWVVFGFGFGGALPVILSFSNDVVESDKRSRFFGVLEVFSQGSRIVGMVASSWLLQVGLWREYFWLTGGILFLSAAILMVTIHEPKRGAMQAELATVLASPTVQYNFKLTKEIVKKTLLNRTNMAVFIEGIFTNLILSISIYLLYPYIQNPPYNISPVASSTLTIFFGMPGVIFGTIVFAKLSDRLAKRNIAARANIIAVAIIGLYLTMIAIFFIPLPTLTPGEGDLVSILITQPIILLFCGFLFLTRSMLGIYQINQQPFIQAINLPEAQATISAWNQFLETVGKGIGPLIAGIALEFWGASYQIAAIITMSLGIPGPVFWLLAARWVKKDRKTIQDILETRANELDTKSRNLKCI
ncbi:MAG: arabinose efflux permease family protein [Promethearchaeota archaeon CR_4]|nr:MAG: arabinose efflux permease family protein [Candidatus Lokiarchaeota archaeon CR_4]